jgi:hypothetical protein
LITGIENFAEAKKPACNRIVVIGKVLQTLFSVSGVPYHCFCTVV